MRGKANWIKKMTTLLLCAVLLLRCSVFVMPSALAEESAAPAETTLCEICGANPCTCDDEPTLCETCGEATCVCESEATPTAEDYSDSVSKYARLNDYYSDGYVFVHDGSDSFAITSALFFEYADFEEGLTFLITDWYLDSVNSALWYQVETYEGALPEGMSDGYWILQNYTNENADEDTLLFVTIEESDESENPCGCCEDCTGDENCTCECEGCTCVEQEPDEPGIPSVEALVTDSEGNELTDSEGNPLIVTVSGEALPDGAEVVAIVPTVNGELLDSVYDIKVLVDGVEWQPIDYGETVTVTIPVNIDKECTGVLHFIDHADAIDGDEMIISTEGVDTADLVLFQSAIDAYGDGVHVAMETISVVRAEDGFVSFETNSFSLYTPDYEVVTDGAYTITFTSSDEHSDNANEQTYYAPVGQVINFKTEWNQGENWSITTLVGDATEEVDDLDSTGIFAVYGTSSCSVTFDAEGIEVGDIFQIDWETSRYVYNGKNPRWTRVMIVGEYSTTFNTNGGSFSDGSTTLSKTIVSYQPVSMIEEPTRAGYMFTGWGTTQDSTGGGIVYTSADNFPATLADGTVFYAQWEAKQYTVTYVLPDGVSNAGEFANQIQYHDAELTLHTTTPSDLEEGMNFLYWIGSDGNQYDPGDTYMGNADLTLVGEWNPAVYSVVYDANGGTDAPEAQYVYSSHNYTTTLSTDVPSRVGYMFTGWNTAKDGTGNSYVGGTEYTLDSSIILYAQWSAVTYTIAFNGNGSTSGSMSNMENLYYESSYANLTANAFSRDEYTFQGWSLTSNGVVQYSNGQNVKVSDLVDAAVAQGLTDSTITLYAVWAQSTYKIVYQAADGDSGVSITNLSQTVIYAMAEQTTINSSATRNRYTFVGWTDGTTVYQTDGAVPVPSEEVDGATITLTATWKMNIVGYICYMNGSTPVLSGTVSADGITDPDNPGSYVTIQAAEGDSIPDMVFTPAPGYKITRIRIEDVDQDISSLVAADGTYTHPGFTANAPYYVAVITEEIPTYTVTWQNYDGAVLETDENVTEGAEPSYDGEEPTRSATAQYTYTFSGWTPDVSNVTGDITYTAVYTEEVRKYTITWANYDGSELKTDEVAYGDTPVWSGENPTYATNENGYTWIGWEPEITAVKGEATYKATYTVWSTITWENWDGTVLETDEQVGTSVLPTYDSATPTRPADAHYTYTFSGWSPSVDLAKQHVTYTAQYSTTTNTYTVIWKNEDGTVLETDENVPYGITPSYDGSAPTKAADSSNTYTFSGWSPAVSGVTGDITYTATYVAEKHIVSVTITWSDLTFTYTPGDWNPQTHTYADGSFTPENATITVINSAESTTAVDASISYQKGDDAYAKSIEAQFSIGADGEKLGTAEKDGIIPGSTVVFYLWLSGRVDDLSQGDFISGTCTVTIEAGSG